MKEKLRSNLVAKPSVLVLLCACFLLAVGFFAYPQLWAETGANRENQSLFERKTDRININTAPAEELALLPNIGTKTAAAIVAWREANGPFANLEEVGNVAGIGEKTLEKIKDRICF